MVVVVDEFKVCRPVWEYYIPPALEQSKLECAPGALVVGRGLESVQNGMDANTAGFSASQVVVEL